jgi:hypothetical protein
MVGGVRGKLSVVVSGALAITRTTKTNAAGEPKRAVSVGGVAAPLSKWAT